MGSGDRETGRGGARVSAGAALALLLCAACGKAPESGAAGAPAGMIFVPGGAFVMGSDKTDEEGLQARYGFTVPLFVNEHPRHRAELAAFYIDTVEVSSADYKAFVLETGRPEPAEWVQNAYNVADRKLATAHVDNLRWIARDYFQLEQDTSALTKDELLARLRGIQRARPPAGDGGELVRRRCLLPLARQAPAERGGVGEGRARAGRPGIPLG